MESLDILTQAEEVVIVGNELWRIIVMSTIIALAFLAGRIGRFVLNRATRKLKGLGRELIVVALASASRSVTFLFFSFGLRIGLSFLRIPDGISDLVFTIVELLIVLAIGHLIYRMVDVVDAWMERFSREKQEGETTVDEMLVPIVGKALRITVVILVLLQAAQTLSDQPITSILAGIGIGGLALGLAAQDTIRNFFGSLMIFADKPFDVGELITLQDQVGVVDEVGVRTTKIRTLDGHLLTVPNGQLANTTIHNIGKRPFIRRVFDVTITYDTPPEKVDRALEILKEILDNHEGMSENLPPRVYFDELNADSLNLKCFYWYHPPIYWDYMNFSEKVNKEIFRRFNEEGIEFAFPTQTLYLAGDENRPLTVGVREPDNKS